MQDQDKPRALGSLNIEAVETVKNDDGTRQTWYQKHCYHCGAVFIAQKANALGCSQDHANSVSRHVKRNGSAKLSYKFKNVAKRVDFSVKKYEGQKNR